MKEERRTRIKKYDKETKQEKEKDIKRRLHSFGGTYSTHDYTKRKRKGNLIPQSHNSEKHKNYKHCILFQLELQIFGRLQSVQHTLKCALSLRKDTPLSTDHTNMNKESND